MAIYLPHSTHTLQPLDVSLFGPLAKAYSDELEQFLHDCQVLSHITKREFFRLFWAGWGKAFTAQNVNSGWKAVGLHPWNPEIVLTRFFKEPEERPSSSESSTSILTGDDWRRISSLLKDAVTDICDRNARGLNDSIIRLSTENTLLKLRCEGLEKAITHDQKRRKRGNALPAEIRAPEDGGAIFYSPSKIQRAREIQEETARLARAAKEQDQLRRQEEKEEKGRKKALLEERKRMRTIAREQKAQERPEKQRQKEKRIAEKQANQQAQKDIRQASRRHQTANDPIAEANNGGSHDVPAANRGVSITDGRYLMEGKTKILDFSSTFRQVDLRGFDILMDDIWTYI